MDNNYGLRNYSSLKKIMMLMFMLTCSFNFFAQQTVSDKTTAFLDAIRSGSAIKLQQQLTNGANANDSLYSYSALMAATLNGSVQQ